MHRHSWIGRPPRITLTHDFHELVRGDLVPRRRVVLRYDPLRIVPPDDGYVFGDPTRPVTAHVAFRRDGSEAETIILASPAGMLENPDIDVTGAGSMLRGELALPDDAEELGVWFSYDSPHTGRHVDDDFGRRFRFGFISLQLRILSADVAAASNLATPDGGRFELEVGVRNDVERVMVRMSLVNHPDFPKCECDLAATEREEDGWHVWRLSPVEVPGDAIVRYKLYYWIAGLSYKDDNDGEYYLAPLPPPEMVPPPPRELLEAAKRWG